VKPTSFTLQTDDVFKYLEEEVVFKGGKKLILFDDPVNELIALKNCRNSLF
jgi:hypothetical protein